MATDNEPDNLPVPAESARTYIRIRPTDATLAAATLTAQHRRLHHLLQPPRGWRATPPTLELLLVSSEANTVDYYAGITDPEKHDGLERVLRSLFPDAYEFDRVTCADSWLAAPAHAAGSVATIEYHGRGDHPKDWQTQLTPYETFVADEHGRVPLASVVEALATSETPAVYQVLLRAKPDWTRAARNRVIALEAYQDTVIDQVTNAIMGPPESDVRLPPADETRIEEIQAREAHTTFETAVRVAAFGEGAVQLTETLQSAFVEVGRSTYTIRPRQNTGRRAKAVFSQIEKRAFPTRTLRNRLPIARRTRSTIVADCTEIANFTMLDGNALTDAGVRSVGSTPSEQSPVTRPPAKQLETYQTAGMTLGYPLDEDGTPDSTPIALPPSLQPMHLAWFGKSGSGKTVAIINAILDAVASTEGVNIIVDWKGDGLGEEYCAAHYARYGTLDNVSYFDCARVLPAFSFFDIRDELAAGISRTTAVEDRVDHYIEILTQLMGRERFDQAVRSPDIIRYLTKAAFDPIHGDDAYSHRHLHGMVRRMHERQSAPGVSDPDLERMLGGVVANQTRSFDEIMQGVANRMEKIPVDRRLARIFNHVPADDDDPHFDLLDYLDETHVIIFDMGSLRSDAQRVLTLVVFSNLWTALRRRHRQYREMEAKSDMDLPLVNLFIDEAASVVTSDLLTDLLSQGRSFRCSVTLATQFPGQLKDQDQRVYEEILNNVSTFVTGNVAVDPLLAERLATDDMDATAVGNRLRALRRGQWLVNLPANFNEPEPRPFLVGSVSLPRATPMAHSRSHHASSVRSSVPSPLLTPEHSILRASHLRRRTPRCTATIQLPRWTKRGRWLASRSTASIVRFRTRSDCQPQSNTTPNYMRFGVSGVIAAITRQSRDWSGLSNAVRVLTMSIPTTSPSAS
ncbi:ATP-binding protein [Halospeciosus flavus]|uniref:ATP-binding protein n=1 Tax=Halospeciosus flavus TaxID=3032283 RepID=UPI003608210E